MSKGNDVTTEVKKKVQKCIVFYNAGICLVEVGRKEEDIGELEWEKLLRLNTNRRKNPIPLLKRRIVHLEHFVT